MLNAVIRVSNIMGYISKEYVIFILIKLHELFQRLLRKCEKIFDLNINR
jgi:hypothetical protein